MNFSHMFVLTFGKYFSLIPTSLTHKHAHQNTKKTTWTWRVNFPHYKISRRLPTNFSSSLFSLKVHCHQCRIRMRARKIFGLFIWLEVFFWNKIFPTPNFFISFLIGFLISALQVKNNFLLVIIKLIIWVCVYSDQMAESRF